MKDSVCFFLNIFEAILFPSKSYKRISFFSGKKKFSFEKKRILANLMRLVIFSLQNCSKIVHNVHIMNDLNKSQDYLNILRSLHKKESLSQREISKDLGISLGKVNYCLKHLRAKGLLKVKNFKKNPNKINYIYILTPKGIIEKTKLTINFMKRKMKEYDLLKKELEDLEKIEEKNNSTSSQN